MSAETHPGGRPLSDEERGSLLREMTEVVTTSHLFKSLDEHGRDRVLAAGYVCRFEPGERIIEEGTKGQAMYLVLDGKVRVETQRPGGTLQLAELSRGACVGEVAVLTGMVRTASVVAIDSVDCVAFEKESVEAILVDYPRVRQVLEALIEGRARDTIEKIVSS